MSKFFLKSAHRATARLKRCLIGGCRHSCRYKLGGSYHHWKNSPQYCEHEDDGDFRESFFLQAGPTFPTPSDMSALHSSHNDMESKINMGVPNLVFLFFLNVCPHSTFFLFVLCLHLQRQRIIVLFDLWTLLSCRTTLKSWATYSACCRWSSPVPAGSLQSAAQ